VPQNSTDQSRDDAAAEDESLSPEEKDRVFREEALPHLNALYNYARSISRSREDAEDLVQETYLRAYRFFDQYTPGTNCKAWLFTILRNLYNTEYKKSPDQVHYETTEEIYGQIKNVETTDMDRNPEDEFFENLMPDEIVQAIEDLPEEYRSSIILADIEDFSYKEIAEILDVPIGTVMSRLHRARNILKKKLVDFARERGVISESADEEV